MRCEIIKSNDQYTLKIFDINNKVIRRIELVRNNQYIINSIVNKRKRNQSRKVIFQEIIQDNRYTYAKVKFLDNLRPGKVEIGDLDIITPTSTNASQNNFIDNGCKEPAVIFEELVPLFNGYRVILNLIESRMNTNRIASISQKEIAAHACVSPTKVSLRINQLIRYGALQKISPGSYKLMHNDLWHTPYRNVHKVIDLALEKPELNYKEQAELLNVTMNDIAQAWAYIKMIK